MTRERAIEVLKAWELNWSDSFTANEFEQAFDMAIASLKTDEAYQLEYENRDFVEIPKGITNGEVIQAMFGSGKVIDFTHKVRLMGKVGNWFNDGVVADFEYNV